MFSLLQLLLLLFFFFLKIKIILEIIGTPTHGTINNDP